MKTTAEPAPACYREATNGVRFSRNVHRIDCDDPDCRGCRPCSEPNHCTASRNCSWHVAQGELTCGRCLTAVRRDLRWVGVLASLMPSAAEGDGANSEAAYLAGPVADPEAWGHRKVSARTVVKRPDGSIGPRKDHISLVEEDDEHHAANVIGTWARMIAEDYRHDMPFQAPLMWCVDYLDRTLARIAHDDEQDFPLLGRELRKCRQHHEAVLHNDQRGDRGATCPECSAARRREYEAAEREGRDIERLPPPPRLRREYAHWCDDPDCERQLHFADDSADVWRCPKDGEHWWTQQGYAELLDERRKRRSA